MHGLFVVFEGVDGSGKGTVLRLVKKALIRKGIGEKNIVVTAEPTNGFYGKQVRELLSSSESADKGAEKFLELYVQDRHDHLRSVVKPAVERGKVVLCDRFKYSTFVYQSLQGIPPGKIFSMHKGMIVPDLVFVLNIDAGTAFNRLSRRKSKDVFEEKNFMGEVVNSFAKLPELFPGEDIVLVDASKPVDYVVREVEAVLWRKIKKAD